MESLAGLEKTLEIVNIMHSPKFTSMKVCINKFLLIYILSIF